MAPPLPLPLRLVSLVSGTEHVVPLAPCSGHPATPGSRLLGAGEEARHGDDDTKKACAEKAATGMKPGTGKMGPSSTLKKRSAQEEVTPKNKGKETAATVAGPFKGRRASPSIGAPEVPTLSLVYP